MSKVTSFLEKLNIQIEFEQYARLNAYSMNFKPFKMKSAAYEEEKESDDDEVEEQRNYILFREITSEIESKHDFN